MTELVAESGVSRATTYRIVAALIGHGFLARSADGLLSAGPRLAPRGAALRAQPLLVELRDATGESAQLFVRRGQRRMCLAAVESMYELRTSVPVGSLLPLGRGSGGKALRGASTESGYFVSMAERAPGVASVSAPVMVGGTVVAAISVSGPIERMGMDAVRRMGETVVRAAAKLSTWWTTV
ncbi:MAG: ArsR family transcriptional regulator [Pseudonocardiales bacterium]|nr:MAG: ArsR family transcriptional regulator [Pseudonocardiales bacterium]